jgi:hypothetical protein
MRAPPHRANDHTRQILAIRRFQFNENRDFNAVPGGVPPV